MPNKQSAKKELRKTIKRKKANNSIKANTKKLIKDTIKNLESKEVVAKDKVTAAINNTIQSIDKMMRKGIIKKNTASRQKSKLQKKANKAK
ncbi:30S ribosomal protein S20 [Candidatus Falkowbacteria bacterium CG10_big_fil_rev_8_21_14_0_10_39_9]|uniref:Small ribosomal subunit protein bS20 n=1 Tax=Candidatus Falkowbacteria bacterium CG10_big_fil_rev_8_21_14_0_10_39_9 TaxID=1974566 RepID=A0A2M6WQP4_9BACT|nr:MAG: 30S ribosomal protein S20 [Candidatus Falkowbacteria bacterium CG10_big_fil_rev_8_21_14_0_10_39_9]